MAQELAGMRVDYVGEGLDVEGLAGTWHEQLVEVVRRSTGGGVPRGQRHGVGHGERRGRPSSRTVLCKGFDERGVVFYTNYTSSKSHDLRVVRYASATFPWYAQHRQVHVRGPVEEVAPEETQEYWASRPRGSQLGSWASPQSTVVRDRRVLDDALAAITAAVRRRRAGAGAGALGRLADPARAGGVLAGPGRPDARPAALRARPGRPHLGGSPHRALIGITQASRRTRWLAWTT